MPSLSFRFFFFIFDYIITYNFVEKDYILVLFEA